MRNASIITVFNYYFSNELQDKGHVAFDGACDLLS